MIQGGAAAQSPVRGAVQADVDRASGDLTGDPDLGGSGLRGRAERQLRRPAALVGPRRPGHRQERAEVGAAHEHLPILRQGGGGGEEQGAHGGQGRPCDVARQGHGEAAPPRIGGQADLRRLLQARQVGAAEPGSGPRGGEDHPSGHEAPLAAGGRDIEGAAPRRALRLEPQARIGLRLAVEGHGEVEGGVAQEGGQGPQVPGPDPFEQAHEGGRHGRLDLPGDPARPVGPEGARQGRARPGEVGDLEAVDHEARAVGLDLGGDGAVARSDLTVAHVLGLDRQGEIEALEGREGGAEGRQGGDVEAARPELRLEPAAGVALGGDVAGVARQARGAEGGAQVAQGEARRAGGDVGRHVQRPSVEDGDQRIVHPEPAQQPADLIRVRGRHRHRPVQLQRRALDLAARRDGRVPRRGGREAPQQEPAAPLHRGGQGEVRPFGPPEAGAVDGGVEVEHHRQAPAALGNAAGDERLALGRGQEGIEVESPGLQRQAPAPLVQVEASAALQAKGLAPRVEFEAHGIEADLLADGLEGAGQGEGQVGSRRLGRRPDDESRLALGRHGAGGGIGLAGAEAEAGIDLEDGRGVAPAGNLDGQGALGVQRSAHRAEGHPAARPLDLPGADQGRRLNAQVGGREPLDRPRLEGDGGDGELSDVQILDREVLAAQAGQEPCGETDRVAPGHRKPDLGPADPGLREADLALQQGREGDLGIDRPGIDPGAAVIADVQPVELDPRGGQEPDRDAPLASHGGAEGSRERPIDEGALGRPIDEGRNGEGRDQDEDDRACQRGQQITHRSRSRPLRATGRTAGPSQPPRASRPGL